MGHNKTEVFDINELPVDIDHLGHAAKAFNSGIFRDKELQETLDANPDYKEALADYGHELVRIKKGDQHAGLTTKDRTNPQFSQYLDNKHEALTLNTIQLADRTAAILGEQALRYIPDTMHNPAYQESFVLMDASNLAQLCGMKKSGPVIN